MKGISEPLWMQKRKGDLTYKPGEQELSSRVRNDAPEQHCVIPAGPEPKTGGSLEQKSSKPGHVARTLFGKKEEEAKE